MPANPPALFPTLAGGINNIKGDDEDFGDFVFSFPSSSHTSSFFTYPTSTVLSTADANDEEWGDFVASQIGSHSLQPQSSLPFSPPFDPSPPRGKTWVKPKGAIPLSVFGEEEEEETDPVNNDGSGVFENGFGSYSFSTYSSSRPATAGKLNDLIERLYGQFDVGGEEEGDDFDEGSWEFNAAMPADAKPMMDEGAVFGLEMVAAANENGRSQIVVNRLENGCKGMEQLNMDGQERGLVDIFSSHAKLTNRSLDHNHSVTDKSLHEMLPSFGNWTSTRGTNGFKIEFPEYAMINGFTEKIQDDQAKLLHPPENQEDRKEVVLNMRDFDDLNISAYANGKKNLDGNFEDHIEHNTGAGKMDYSPVSLTSIIHNIYEKTNSSLAILPSQSSINNGQGIDQLGKSSIYVNGDIDFDHFDWKFHNAVETGEDKNICSYESNQCLANELSSYTLVDLYCRLKEESLSLIVHHLVVLKVPALLGATPEVKKINEEIQEAHGNLQEMIASEDSCTGKQIASRINQLLNVTRTSNFEAVEQECHLSERLLAAEKHLNSAVDLFEHSSSVLRILRLASRDQQLFYINAWSKLASACAAELQLGAKIRTESLDGNISKQILNKGNKYFLALGEVYRVSKILKATVRFYMPWLLSNLEDSIEIVTCLQMGNEAWINSGLEEALQIISSNMDLDDKGLAKPLLDSIRLIDKVNEPTFEGTSFQHKNRFCRFSLLPLDKLPGIKTVIWNGNCYISKIANLWANRISPDPPELPFIMPS